MKPLIIISHSLYHINRLRHSFSSLLFKGISTTETDVKCTFINIPNMMILWPWILLHKYQRFNSRASHDLPSVGTKNGDDIWYALLSSSWDASRPGTQTKPHTHANIHRIGDELRKRWRKKLKISTDRWHSSQWMKGWMDGKSDAKRKMIDETD